MQMIHTHQFWSEKRLECHSKVVFLSLMFIVFLTLFLGLIVTWNVCLSNAYIRLWATYCSSCFSNINFLNNQPMTNLWSSYYRFTAVFQTMRSGMFQNADIVVLSVPFRSGFAIRSLQLSQLRLSDKSFLKTQWQITSSFQSFGDFRKGLKTYDCFYRWGTWSTEKITHWTRLTFSGASGCQTQIFWLLNSPLFAALPCWPQPLQPYCQYVEGTLFPSIAKSLEPLRALSRIPVHSMLERGVRFWS